MTIFETQRCGPWLINEYDGEILEKFCSLIEIFCGSYPAGMCWRRLCTDIVGLMTQLVAGCSQHMLYTALLFLFDVLYVM